MKKIITLILCGCLTAGVLSGCSSSAKETDHGQAEGQSETTVTEQSTPTAKEESLTALTDEEKELWYSKYYHETPTPPSEEVLNALKTPLSEEDIIAPDQMELVLDLDREFTTGYALLDNGATYVAVESVYTDVTPEMYSWYREWSSGLENQQLVYKIWNPGAHIIETSLGDVTWTKEDMGMGVLNLISTGGSTLEDKGVDPQLAENPQILMAGGSNSISWMAESNVEDTPLLSNILHVFYINDDGFVTDRCVIMEGYIYQDGEPVFNLNGNTLTEERAQKMAEHVAQENSNLASVIIEAYADNVTNAE